MKKKIKNKCKKNKELRNMNAKLKTPRRGKSKQLRAFTIEC